MILQIIAALLVLNAVTYLIYAYDKTAARSGVWRVSESTLLGLAFIGGAPAAIAAMFTLRHKIRKPKFRAGLLLILAAQTCLFIYWRTTSGVPA